MTDCLTCAVTTLPTRKSHCSQATADALIALGWEMDVFNGGTTFSHDPRDDDDIDYDIDFWDDGGVTLSIMDDTCEGFYPINIMREPWRSALPIVLAEVHG